MNRGLARRARLMLVTAANEQQAASIARALVDERLAACVNLWPIRSLYRWLDAVHDEREVMMLVKTDAALVARVERRVAELHSYEVPEIIALAPAAGSEPYLRWLLDSTAKSPSPRRSRPAPGRRRLARR